MFNNLTPDHKFYIFFTAVFAFPFLYWGIGHIGRKWFIVEVSVNLFIFSTYWYFIGFGKR